MNSRFLLSSACLILISWPGLSQTIITSLSRNGEIEWSSKGTSNVVCVQWASTLTGPWHSSWNELSSITTTSEITRANVPMFYRIREFGTASIASALTDRTSTSVNPAALNFMPPAGDGRSHRAGVMIFPDTSFDAFGSTWEFDYLRDDWGVQVVHPYRNGQCIVSIYRHAIRGPLYRFYGRIGGDISRKFELERKTIHGIWISTDLEERLYRNYPRAS